MRHEESVGRVSGSNGVMHTSIPAQGNALGISEHRFLRSEGTPHREGTAIMSPPGMGNQGVALRWYAVSRWDMASPQRGDRISAWGATPGKHGTKPMRSEGTPHREGTAIMSCPPEMGKENMAPNQSPGRCPSLVCGVPLGHGESRAHGSTSSGDGKRKTWHQIRA